VSLPKPVIVVLVIVLVLAVVGCGMTVLGASQQDSNADPPIADLRGSNFTKFFQIFSPPSKEIGPGDFTTNCGTSDPGLLAVSSGCSLNIGPTADQRRRLVLRPVDALVTMSVTIVFPSPQPSANSGGQQIGTSDDDRDKGSVVLNRDASATVTLECLLTCHVAVNPTPPP